MAAMSIASAIAEQYGGPFLVGSATESETESESGNANVNGNVQASANVNECAYSELVETAIEMVAERRHRFRLLVPGWWLWW